MYQEMKSKQIKQYQKDLTMQFTNQQQAGTEEANGFKCTKYTADFKDNDGSKGSGSYWVNSDEIIVRAVMTSKRRFKTTETTMNITNLKVGDQPDELFEVPAGYSSMGLGALMGNAFGKSQEDAPEAHSGDQPKTDDPEQQSANDGAAADNAVKNVRNALKGLFNRNKN
jgi:hypothetical protein